MTAVADAVAELEHLAAYTQISAGLIPEWARRPLMPWELRAGVNYAAIDRILRDSYLRAERTLTGLRADLAADLAATVGGATDRIKVDSRVTAWAAGRPQSSARLVAAATRELVLIYRRTALAARGQVLAEAAYQNVTPVPGPTRTSFARTLILNPDDPEYDPDRDPFRNIAATPTSIVQGKVEGAALAASQRPTTPDAAIKGAADVNISAGVDSARQGAHIANGEGRLDAVSELPEPEEIYASELLDSATCVPCEQIDGVVFSSIGQAELSYPGSGPYRLCLGGSRCRGTLVFVWGES